MLIHAINTINFNNTNKKFKDRNCCKPGEECKLSFGATVTDKNYIDCKKFVKRLLKISQKGIYVVRPQDEQVAVYKNSKETTTSVKDFTEKYNQLTKAQKNALKRIIKRNDSKALFQWLI